MKTGDLVHIPANTSLCFRDGDSWCFFETRTPTYAVFLTKILSSKEREVMDLWLTPQQVKVYWDNKYCWVGEKDVFVFEKRKGVSL